MYYKQKTICAETIQGRFPCPKMDSRKLILHFIYECRNRYDQNNIRTRIHVVFETACTIRFSCVARGGFSHGPTFARFKYSPCLIFLYNLTRWIIVRNSDLGHNIKTITTPVVHSVGKRIAYCCNFIHVLQRSLRAYLKHATITAPSRR